MLRATINKRLICAAFFPFSSTSNVSTDEKPSEQRIMLDKLNDLLFDNRGDPTKELQSVINSTLFGTLVGFVLGAVDRTKMVMEIHKSQNLATSYENKFEAARQIQNRIAINVIKGGFSVGAKLGTFCFLFSGISTSLYVYRGKYDILNAVYSGGLSGFLYNFNMGLKGIFSATLLGSVLGTIYGSITVLMLYITGIEMEDLYISGAAFANARRAKIREQSKKLMSQEELEIKKLYDLNKKMQ